MPYENVELGVLFCILGSDVTRVTPLAGDNRRGHQNAAPILSLSQSVGRRSDGSALELIKIGPRSFVTRGAGRESSLVYFSEADAGRCHSLRIFSHHFHFLRCAVKKAPFPIRLSAGLP